jgi:tetratricopeptide (TPR) repeat protein
MLVTASGRTLDQLKTSEHVEPAGGFARTLARELVESLVHSQRLAAHADAATGGPTTPPPMNGAGVNVVAMSPSPPPPSPSDGAAPPGAVTTLIPNPSPPPPSAGGKDIAAARAHARQGLAFYDLNHFQQAYDEYEQAYLIEQDAALLYNMGQCQRKLGNNDEALHFYRTYLRRVPKGPSAIEAEKRIRELEDATARPRK